VVSRVERDRQPGLLQARRGSLVGAHRRAQEPDPLACRGDLRHHAEELQALLAARGRRFSIGALWRFFACHNITWKKDRSCKRARPPGHSEATGSLVRQPARPRPREARLHRRDLGDEEHCAQERPRPEGREVTRQRSAWSCMDTRSTQEKTLCRRARDRVLPCVRPLMRPFTCRGPVWEFADQVHITGARSKRYPCARFS